MRKEYSIEEKHIIDPVFLAELKSDLKDHISGSNPVTTGSMTTFDPVRGLYFNGSAGLRWSFDQLAFDPTLINIDTSFTLLLDYNRSSRSGHDWMFVLGSDSNKQLIGFLYDYNSKYIGAALSRGQYRTDRDGTTLNTQYSNCGLTYDGVTHTIYPILDGVKNQSGTSITNFPTITSAMSLYVGQSSYNGDRMNGYLKNIRFYLEKFDDSML